MDQLITVFSAEALTVPVCTVRLLLSFVAGCILGLERKFRMQFVGMRTLVLICVSSSLLMMLSVYTVQIAVPLSGDPARIAAQVVSGIGFLGAGAILRHGLNVRGLTSAGCCGTGTGDWSRFSNPCGDCTDNQSVFPGRN